MTYDASKIKVLEGLEAVRKRPGMYIGSTDSRGLHHLIFEIFDNSIDEALAGYCNFIKVIVHKDGYITVEDNGRGIPVDIHPKTKKSALETVFTVLHAGGKFDKNVYKISGGLHGVGASVVNALSKHLIVTVKRNGNIYKQEYSKGIPITQVEIIGKTNETGTTVKFIPDDSIFSDTKFDINIIETKIKHAAFLTPGITINLIDENKNINKIYRFEGGIKSWLEKILFKKQLYSQIYEIKYKKKDLELNIAFAFSDNSFLISFVNHINTTDGGTHEIGFKNGLLKAFNEIASSKNLIDKKIGELNLSDITENLYAIIDVKIPEPQFEGQTKTKLGNSEIKKEIENITYNFIKKIQNENEIKKILEKFTLNAKARLAAKLAKETIIKKSSNIVGILPGKLTDCSTKDRLTAELFIVEGNSAGGSAKQARDSKFQAILPLKGKILNTEQASLQKILENDEIKALITAIGTGIKDNFDESKLRYGKIIIMTDADVDGAHIRTLLLTFFFRFYRKLIEKGFLYEALPPLYKISQGNRYNYVYPPLTLEEAIEKYGYDKNKVIIQRYKGLGEMNPQQLWETTMDPKTRTLKKINIADTEEADKLFKILMGEDVQSRKTFILTNAKNVKELDI